MNNNLSVNLGKGQRMYACSDASCGRTEESALSGRDVFTRQTGHLLATLGQMFIDLPAFNSHIDADTGEMLIALGNKLARK